MVLGLILDPLPAVEALKAKREEDFHRDLSCKTGTTDDAVTYAGLKQCLIDKDLDDLGQLIYNVDKGAMELGAIDWRRQGVYYFHATQCRGHPYRRHRCITQET